MYSQMDIDDIKKKGGLAPLFLDYGFNSIS